MKVRDLIPSKNQFFVMGGVSVGALGVAAVIAGKTAVLALPVATVVAAVAIAIFASYALVKGYEGICYLIGKFRKEGLYGPPLTAKEEAELPRIDPSQSRPIADPPWAAQVSVELQENQIGVPSEETTISIERNPEKEVDVSFDANKALEKLEKLYKNMRATDKKMIKQTAKNLVLGAQIRNTRRLLAKIESAGYAVKYSSEFFSVYGIYPE